VKQKTALIIAAGVTAFMLVTAGAVIRTASSQPQRTVAQSASTPSSIDTIAAPPTATTNAQYIQLIDEANSRIQQLKDENVKLRQALEQAKAGDNMAAASAPAAGQISADAAMQAALTLAPGAQLLSLPELVDFQGTTAYEVALDAGTVYVDAASGQPIYAISARQRNRQQFEQHENEEHEEHEDHEGGSDS
jgi:hypothetical protein